MSNAFNEKLKQEKIKRSKRILKMKEKGLAEKEIAFKLGITRQKVNELINYARRNNEQR